MTNYKDPGIYFTEHDISYYHPFAPKWYKRRIKLGNIFGFEVPEKHYASYASSTGTGGSTGVSGVNTNKPVMVKSYKEATTIFNAKPKTKKFQNNRRFN